MNIDVSRCDYIENINKYCAKEFIFYPSNEFTVKKDESFKPLDTSGSAIQVKPQRIDVKLRPRMLSNISFFLNKEKKFFFVT